MTPERKKALQNLKTARGQIDGIIRMIEDERHFKSNHGQSVTVKESKSAYTKWAFAHMCKNSDCNR